VYFDYVIIARVTKEKHDESLWHVLEKARKTLGEKNNIVYRRSRICVGKFVRKKFFLLRNMLNLCYSYLELEIRMMLVGH